MTTEHVYDKAQREHGRYFCRACADRGKVRGADERFSLGIYAGMYCDACWKVSGYRDADASAFDPDDAGEYYDADE